MYHVVAIFTPTTFDRKNLQLQGTKKIFNFLRKILPNEVKYKM